MTATKHCHFCDAPIRIARTWRDSEPVATDAEPTPVGAMVRSSESYIDDSGFTWGVDRTHKSTRRMWRMHVCEERSRR